MSYWTAFGLGILSSHLFWFAIGGLLFWLGKLTNHAPEPTSARLRAAIQEGIDTFDYDMEDGCPYGVNQEDRDKFLMDCLLPPITRAIGEV